ncbi:hypothetical protein [Pseudonocardia nigra]|uniref:hypothetical protein n=1 Tax=Pseudonocardia nigra TaxID=1921578 RepID=UPI001C5EA1C4|nr:hypothetical protein [Pseudonocardia nigra]
MERRLLTICLPPDFVPTVPGEGGVFNLVSPFDGYGPEWRVVSRTITLLETGALPHSVNRSPVS